MKTIPTKSLICFALLCFSITGCEPSDSQDSQPSTAELQAELEQMENQIGRLEFRVFELEQQLSENPAVATQKAPTAAPADQGRFDLTPVE
jgi:hypothetical protein